MELFDSFLYRSFRFIAKQGDIRNYREINFNLVKELFLGLIMAQWPDISSLNCYLFNDNFSFIFRHYHYVTLDIDYQRNHHHPL